MHGNIERYRPHAAPLPSAKQERLDQLAAAIKRDHAQVQAGEAAALAGLRRSLRYAISCGERLIEAKRLLDHGQWLPWLKALDLPRRTASRYMDLARNKDSIKWAKLAHFTEQVTTRLLTPVEYMTPPQYVEATREVLGHIDLDPASCAEANEIVRADKYYTKEQDGLQQPWHGRVWLNGPYCRLTPAFITKLLDEYRAGNITAAITLVNAYHSDVAWFQLLCRHAVLCYPDHRINFMGPKPIYQHTDQNSAFAYLGSDRDKFKAIFRPFGVVMAEV